MSALRSSTTKLTRTAWKQLTSPWKDVFHAAENDASAERILDIIGTASLDVSGVYMDEVQYNFETVASLTSGDISDIFALMHALVISCATGVPQQDLTKIRPEWSSRVWSLHIQGEPIFVLCCKKSLKKMAGFICKHLGPNPLDTLEQSDHRGDTALHIAVRRRQWEWANWLIGQGCDAHRKNAPGESPFLLASPFSDKFNMFKINDKQKWYDALHEGLKCGRADTRWVLAMLDHGADVNQTILYDSPPDCLLIFAQYGLDMNLGPLPVNLTPDHYRTLYLHGRIPTDWSTVLDAFHEHEWVRFLRDFHTGQDCQVPDEFANNVSRRKAISDETIQVLKRIKELKK